MANFARFSSEQDFRAKMDALQLGTAMPQGGGQGAPQGPATPSGGSTVNQDAHKSGKSSRGRAAKAGNATPGRGPLRVSHFYVHRVASVRRLAAELDPSDDIPQLAAGRCYVCGNHGHVLEECPIKDQRDRWIPVARELSGRERALVGALVTKGKLEAVKL